MSATTSARPIAEGLINWPSPQPQLIAGRCRCCDSLFFPVRPAFHRPGCSERDVEELLLSRRGVLTSYTIHHYQPPPPFRMDPFRSYAIGVVELPEKIQVIGMLTDMPFEDIHVGMKVELVTERLFDDENDCQVHTWKWKPLSPAA